MFVGPTKLYISAYFKSCYLEVPVQDGNVEDPKLIFSMNTPNYFYGVIPLEEEPKAN